MFFMSLFKRFLIFLYFFLRYKFSYGQFFAGISCVRFLRTVFADLFCVQCFADNSLQTIVADNFYGDSADIVIVRKICPQKFF